jgi:hypothetical protein
MTRRHLDWSLLLALVLLCGCATTHPEKYPVIKSFHPDGSGGGVFPEPAALEGAEGYVLSYEAGDTIELTLTLTSDVMHLDGPITRTLVLDRPIRVSVDADGMLVSIEGGPWLPPLSAFTGSIDAGLSMKREDQANLGQLTITAEKR